MQFANFFSQGIPLLLRRRGEPVGLFRLRAQPCHFLAHLRVLALCGLGDGAVSGAFLAEIRDHLDHVPHLVDPLRQGFLALRAGGLDRTVHWTPPCVAWRKLTAPRARFSAWVRTFNTSNDDARCNVRRNSYLALLDSAMAQELSAAGDFPGTRRLSGRSL